MAIGFESRMPPAREKYLCISTLGPNEHDAMQHAVKEHEESSARR